MKYSKFETIDSYTNKMIGKPFSQIGSDLDPDNVLKEAFYFMVSFEKADQFTKSSLKIGEKDASNVLSVFEDRCKEINETADREKQNKRDNEAAARKNAPILWDDEIAPAFKNIAETLKEFKNINGYQNHLFVDALKTEFRSIRNMLNISDKQLKVL